MPQLPSRRSLLKVTAAAAGLPAAAFAVGSDRSTDEMAAEPTQSNQPFQLAYAPHFGMFENSAGKDLVAQLEWAHDQGFTAWEDNGMTRKSVEDQKRVAAAMERLGMTMGVFVANFGTAFGEQTFTSNKKDSRDNFLNDLRSAVEVAKRVNAKWMTVVLGERDPRLAQGYQDASAIDMLRRGAEIFEQHDLVMVMEPLNFRDHPNLYLMNSDHAYMLCKAVRSPAVKILFDIYHQAVSEGNLIPNIDHCWDEIAYFQIGDNPGRNEPGTGDVNYRNIFRHIHQRGFTGVLGMEHGKSQGGLDGETKLLAAYRAADQF